MTRKTATILAPSFVQRIRQGGRYGDGRGSAGLSLLVRVTRNGRISKTWSQRILISGRVTHKGLGAFPYVSLSEARKLCVENKRAVLQGRDPFTSRVPTFESALAAVIEIQRASWKGSAKTEASWRSVARDYLLPRLGSMRVDRIGPADCMAVVLPVWTDKPETARRVLRRLSAVMKWSQAQGHRQDNPAEASRSALPKQTKSVEHHKAVPHSQLAGVLAKVEASAAWTGTKLAFRFMVLTGCRSGEARLASWSEVNREAREWVIPGERMKSGKQFRIPLSPAALKVLAEAEAIRDGSGLIFPSVRGLPMADNTLSKLLRDNQIPMVPHGARSCFRSWCSDVGVSGEVAEASLAHAAGDRTVQAYARSDLFSRRLEVLHRWAHYLTEAPGELVQFRA